jgi:tRNA threonylcarbamoyladenosine biosynthesis protein TsaE
MAAYRPAINPGRDCRGAAPRLQTGPMNATARPKNRGPTTESAMPARDLPDLEATARLAAEIAARVRVGDVIALSGDLGSGKTTFARAFIAALAARFHVPAEEVPSPTFTLVQTYDFPGLPVWHFDLYRLKSAEDAYELGIEDAFASAVSLIEWPQRLGALLSRERLDIAFEFKNGEQRRAVLTGSEAWRARLEGIADG